MSCLQEQKDETVRIEDSAASRVVVVVLRAGFGKDTFGGTHLALDTHELYTPKVCIAVGLVLK